MVADVRFGAGGHKMLDRIIRAKFGKPKGLLVLPRTPGTFFGGEAPFGWTSPFKDLAGNPLVPGTPANPGEVRTRNVFVRGAVEKPPPSTLVRAQDGRLFIEPDAICDWRGKETKEGAGDHPILHFQGPPTRYFPRAEPLGDGDQTFPLYRTSFYDRGGTKLVSGPTPNTAGVSASIRGVAIRNFGTPEEEYVCIIGRIVSPATGLVKIFEVHAKSRTDSSDDWRFLGSTGPYPRLGDEGSVIDFPSGTDLFWEMPLHFNRLGTRAITVSFGLDDAPDTNDARKLFQLEIFVDGETVTDNGLLKILTSTSNTVTRINDDTFEAEFNPQPEDLPDCGDSTSSITLTETSTTNQAFSGFFTQFDAPIAFDYKIDTDEEIGDITVTAIQERIQKTTGGGSESITFSDSCFAVGPGVPIFGAANGSGSTSLVGQFAQDHTQLWSINGGRHSASGIGPIRTDLQDNSNVITTQISTTETVDNEKSGSVTQTRTLLTPDSEVTRMFRSRQTGSNMVGVEWADIRYGSLVLNNRLVIKTGGFDFNSNPEAGNIPSPAAPIGVPAPKNFPFGFGPDDNLGLGILTGDSGVEGFASWGESLKFESRFFIESADFSVQETIEEGFFTEGFFSTNPFPNPNPFIAQIPFYEGGIFFNSPLTVPPGTNEIVEVGEADGVPNYLTDTTSRLPFQNALRVNAGHDRHGSFFYALQRSGNDGSGFVTGPFSGANPNWNFTSYADYGFEDPVARVGMEPNGVNGEATNSTAPFFDPVICV